MTVLKYLATLTVVSLLVWSAILLTGITIGLFIAIGFH